MTNIDKLMNSARTIIDAQKLPNAELYLQKLQLLFEQCKHDKIYRLAKVEWMENALVVFWDTYLMDCEFDIYEDGFHWHIWIGEDQRNHNDNSYFLGFGGKEFEYDDNNFACEFYEFMEENLQHIDNDRLYE